MRLLFFLLIISGATVCQCQQIALLSTDFKKPIIYTDSVTVEQINQGYFAVSSINFDTLYANLKFLKEMLEIRQRSKMESFELRAGSTTIKVEKVLAAYGDTYTIIASTKSGEITSVMSLSNTKKSGKKNAEVIDDMMKYLKSNTSLFTSPYEIKPKLYNIVVVTE